MQTTRNRRKMSKDLSPTDGRINEIKNIKTPIKE